jgi:MHS family proline/betaine transporter-like MFS transporter
LVATWLVNRTTDDLSPAYMIMAAAVVSFLSILTFSERSKAPLDVAVAAA